MLTNVYPNKYGKSDGIFVHEQAKAVQKLGNNVKIIFIDLRSFRKKRHWGERKYTRDSIEIYHYSFPCGPIPMFYELLYFVFSWISLNRLLKKKEVNVIHGHFYINGILAKIIKRKYKIAYVMTEHSSELYEDNIGILHKKMLKCAYNNVDKLLSVSAPLKERMQQYTDREIIVIPNMVSDIFMYSKGVKGNNSFVFIAVGNMIKEKGMRLLVDAFSEIQKKRSKVLLWMIGEGALKRELEIIAKKNDLNIQFFGSVEHEKLPELYQKADCFVLPSEKETFGIVYIEAMACGLPVIATKCGGPESFVHYENGVLINVNDKQALVSAMLGIIRDISSYDKVQISKAIQKKYGMDEIGKKIVHIYREAIAKGRRDDSKQRRL